MIPCYLPCQIVLEQNDANKVYKQLLLLEQYIKKDKETSILLGTYKKQDADYKKLINDYELLGMFYEQRITHTDKLVSELNRKNKVNKVIKVVSIILTGYIIYDKVF